MLWHLVLAFLVGAPTDPVALRDSAPLYLTTEEAAEHLTAARLAGAVYEIDPDILLSIAWHESRYTQKAVTREVLGKVSCGAMTPEPTYDLEACKRATSSLVYGYLAGAHHLRIWLDVTKDDLHEALRGYAGGYALIGACRRDYTQNHCWFWETIVSRAERIRDLRYKRRIRQGVAW